MSSGKIVERNTGKRKMRGAQLVEAEEGGSGKYGLIDEEYFLSESTSDAMGSSLSHFFRVSASTMSAKFAKNLS